MNNRFETAHECDGGRTDTIATARNRTCTVVYNDKSSSGDEIPERDVTYIILSVYLFTKMRQPSSGPGHAHLGDDLSYEG